MERCRTFCERIWIPKQTAKMRRSGLYTRKTLPKGIRFTRRDCKRYYCNPGCKRSFLSKSEINKSFSKKWSRKDIRAFKKKGARSGCVWQPVGR